ncbi:hypothetical protein [Legionella sp. CNM-4043-24]|uniref:hypothetical protein n=1 Tax=Legionella sp. CNM-4043-24 TaxID=3421646 RepID=UPI00403A95A7
MRSKIQKIIIDAVEDLNQYLEDKLPAKDADECQLYGQSSSMDSISLVTLIASVEQKIEDKFGVSIILASEKAMSMRNSPFLSIGKLTDFTLRLVQENTND